MATVGENGVGDDRVAAAHAGVFLVHTHAILVRVKGRVVNLRSALVFHRHTQGTVPNRHVLDDRGRSLADADALVRAVVNEARLNEGIERAFAQVDAVAVESIKGMDGGIAHDAVVHHIVIDGVRVGLVVADEGAAVDEARTVAHVDEVARDVRVQGAIHERDLAVLCVDGVAVVGQQFDVVQRHIREPSHHRRPVVDGV